MLLRRINRGSFCIYVYVSELNRLAISSYQLSALLRSLSWIQKLKQCLRWRPDSQPIFIYDPKQLMETFYWSGKRTAVNQVHQFSVFLESDTLQDIVRYLQSEGADRLKSCSTKDAIAYMRPWRRCFRYFPSYTRRPIWCFTCNRVLFVTPFTSDILLLVLPLCLMLSSAYS